jgi:hypothetical protein
MSFSNLGPKVTGENRIAGTPLDGTGIELHITRNGDEIWIQLRQPGRDKDADWQIVHTSFIPKAGEIRFKQREE